MLKFPVFDQFPWTRAHSMIRPAGLLAAILAFSSPLIGQQDSARQLSQPPSSGRTTLDASENRANPPARELVKLTARSDLVLVPVIVTDKSGKHVSGVSMERLAECQCCRGVLGARAMPLAGRSGRLRFDFDQPIAIVNGENIGAQCREPQDANNFNAVVAAQIEQI